MTPENCPIRSVCIVMLSAIGDAVHVLPVANALKGCGGTAPSPLLEILAVANAMASSLRL